MAPEGTAERTEEVTARIEATLAELHRKYRGNYLLVPPADRHRYSAVLAQGIFFRLGTNVCIKHLAKLNLYFLVKVVLGYSDLTRATHVPVCEHLVQNIKKCLLIMPRGFFKTTISTKSTSIFLIINDPNIRILIANATATNGEAFLREIKAHFESNATFRGLFSELIPPDFKKVPWASDKMQVVRDQMWSEPTIRTTGIEGNVTGMHFNVIIEDDLVNEDHITSPEMMQKPIEWHKMSNSLYVPDADDRKKLNIVVGTRWSYFDFINYVMKELPDYKMHLLSCFDDQGESTFPEKYTTYELQRIKDAQGPLMFSCQFLNNPLPGEIAVFKKEWLKYYTDIPKGMVLRKYLLVDPAISEKKTADNRAVIVVGINEAKDWYILDYTRGIFPLIDDESGKKNLVSEIFRLHALYEPSFVGIEEVGFQKALSFLMKQQFKQRDTHFMITPMLPRNRQTKIMRIETLAAPFAAGRVYLKKDMYELEEELLGFPMARYRDLVDALSYLTQYESTPSQPMTKNNDPLLFDNILDELMTKKNSNYPFADQVGSL